MAIKNQNYGRGSLAQPSPWDDYGVLQKGSQDSDQTYGRGLGADNPATGPFGEQMLSREFGPNAIYPGDESDKIWPPPKP